MINLICTLKSCWPPQPADHGAWVVQIGLLHHAHLYACAGPIEGRAILWTQHSPDLILECDAAALNVGNFHIKSRSAEFRPPNCSFIRLAALECEAEAFHKIVKITVWATGPSESRRPKPKWHPRLAHSSRTASLLEHRWGESDSRRIDCNTKLSQHIFDLPHGRSYALSIPRRNKIPHLLDLGRSRPGTWCRL